MPNGSSNNSKDGKPDLEDNLPNTLSDAGSNSSSKPGDTAKPAGSDKDPGQAQAAADAAKEGLGSASAPSSSQWTAPPSGASSLPPLASAAGSSAFRTGGNAGEANKPSLSDAADQAKDAASSVPTVASETAQDVASRGKEEAKELGDKGAKQMRQAGELAKSGLSEVAEQAKTAASSVVGAASAVSGKAQDVVADAAGEFEDVIEERKAEGAQQLQRLADAIDRAGSELQDEFPLVGGFVKRSASRVDTLAEAVRERPARMLFDEIGVVVRRRPGAVAGVLGLVGFAAIRFLKATPPHSGSRAEDRDQGQEGGTNEDVQRSAATGEGIGSSGPGGISPEAPNFESKSAGGASRSRS